MEYILAVTLRLYCTINVIITFDLEAKEGGRRVYVKSSFEATAIHKDP